MRAFIALMPDENLRRSLLEVINKLQALYPNQLHCVSQEKLHITLHFFKSLKAAHVASVLHVIKETAQSSFPCSLQMTKKLLLPNDEHATVLAYEVQLNNQLMQTKASLNQSLGWLGFEDEHKQFLPHMTIARSKDTQLLQQIQLPELNIDFWVEECILFESCQQAGDFAYKVIGRV